ncbi:MAG: isocitrate lyase/phosphoenolpyruvate mutase family protein [Thermonemataceae bacterium]|mgnify:CR=1 FL=1
MNFKEQHYQKTPLLIANVWNVESAKIAQEFAFEAIGTSSSAIASMLGYNDGEEMSFQELIYLVKRITESVSLPLTVDIEAGHDRNPIKIIENIKELSDYGVVGINIEDSLVNGVRQITDVDTFSKMLETICSTLVQDKQDIFINVRTDTFLLNVPNKIEATIKRATRYRDAGGQGLFVPCIEEVKDIRSVIQNIDLPLNVMCMPNLPDFTTLRKLGVKRISMGNFLYKRVYGALSNLLRDVIKDDSFSNLVNL